MIELIPMIIWSLFSSIMLGLVIVYFMFLRGLQILNFKGKDIKISLPRPENSDCKLEEAVSDLHIVNGFGGDENELLFRRL